MDKNCDYYDYSEKNFPKKSIDYCYRNIKNN